MCEPVTGTTLLVSSLLAAGAAGTSAALQKRQADKAQAAQNEAQRQKDKMLRESAPTVSSQVNDEQRTRERRNLRMGVASTVLTSPLGVQNTAAGLKTKLGV